MGIAFVSKQKTHHLSTGVPWKFGGSLLLRRKIAPPATQPLLERLSAVGALNPAEVFERCLCCPLTLGTKMVAVSSS